MNNIKSTYEPKSNQSNHANEDWSKIEDEIATDTLIIGGDVYIKQSKNYNKISGGSAALDKPANIDKLVTDITTKPNECAFDKSNNSDVCSPAPIIDQMNKFIKTKGGLPSNDPKTTVENVKKIVGCDSESCVLKKDEFKSFAGLSNLEKLLNEYFKPEGNSEGSSFLSNFNIDDVLDQFETKYTDRKFLHIPFQMKDFDKVGTMLANVDLAEKFSEGYKTFGVVINTDSSNGPGIHWFALFGENYDDKVVLEYFNSSGRQPLIEIQTWLNKTKHYLHKEMKKPIEIKYSTGIEFQKSNWACGVFSVAYIWLRLEKVPVSWFNENTFNDSMMVKLRKNMFRWS